MARLALVPFTPLGSYPATLPLVALSADLAFATPGTPSDGISYPNTGREILLAWNTHATVAKTVTISSVALRGRTGDITAYSIPAVTIAVFGPFDPSGWNQSGGALYAVGSTTDVTFAVIRLPNNIFPR